MTTLLVLAGAAAMTCAAAGTALLRRRAHAWGLIDVPNERSLHTRATPRGGGMVILLAVVGGLAVLAWLGAAPIREAAVYAGAALLVAAIGWRDDIRSVAPGRRFLVHLLAAVVAISAWGTFHALQFADFGLALPAAAAVAVTLLWIVGLLNAYNFMDGIDGLASGQAVIGGVVWALLCGADAPLVTTTAILMAGANVGFLWHNWPPARIFMGDAGSGFLGFSFAVLPLMAFSATGDPRLPVAGVLIVAPFVFDTTYTLARRLIHRENVIEAHRTHLYQRLVTSGWSHASTTVIYLALAAASGGAALAWVRGGPGWILIPPLGSILLLPLLVAHALRPDR